MDKRTGTYTVQLTIGAESDPEGAVSLPDDIETTIIKALEGEPIINSVAIITVDAVKVKEKS